MKIIIGFILFIFGSFWLSIIISVGVGTALRLWEKRKNENNENN